MAKLNWISIFMAVTLIAVIIPIIYSKPQGTFPYYSDFFPKSQQRRRIDDHPISVRYYNAPNYPYGFGQRGSNIDPIAEESISQTIPNTSDRKEVLVFLNERPYSQRRSLELPPNVDSRSDALKNKTSNSLPIQGKGEVKLPENQFPLPRGKRDIVFPDHPMPPVQPLGKTPPSCLKEGQVFCTEVDSYPSDVLEKILKSSPEKYQEAFGDDIPNTVVTQRVDVRIDAEEETLCDSEEKVIHPKVGLTIDNEFEYIVNVANYTQGIRVEECKNANTTCKMTNSFPNGYKTECRQKYIYRNLLGYRKEGRVEKNLYQFPSCCQCVLKPNYSK